MRVKNVWAVIHELINSRLAIVRATQVTALYRPKYKNFLNLIIVAVMQRLQLNLGDHLHRFQD